MIKDFIGADTGCALLTFSYKPLHLFPQPRELFSGIPIGKASVVNKDYLAPKALLSSSRYAGLRRARKAKVENEHLPRLTAHLAWLPVNLVKLPGHLVCLPDQISYPADEARLLDGDS